MHFNADFPATLLAPFRTHLQYRFALPWTCLVVVCIAAPLGIGYSRRGVLSSVAAAVFLVFSINSSCTCFSRSAKATASLHGWRHGRRTFFCRDWPVSALFASVQPRSPRFSPFRRASYRITMNPLPNEWAITHRADVCAVTHRPFVAGEYFYTLLYHSADGYRREDLSEEAWQNRNENVQPFHSGNRATSRCHRSRPNLCRGKMQNNSFAV